MEIFPPLRRGCDLHGSFALHVCPFPREADSTARTVASSPVRLQSILGATCNQDTVGLWQAWRGSLQAFYNICRP